MLEEAGVELWMNSPIAEGAASVRVNQSRITSLKISRNASNPQAAAATVWVEASYVIDASYEGDVLISAGVTHTLGREAASAYNESLGGVSRGSVGQFEEPVSPYVKGTT
eukprot:1809671-Pyramimonas_sp.AAC.1